MIEMNKKLFLGIFVLFFIPFVFASVSFESPTPIDNSVIMNNTFCINTSSNEVGDFNKSKIFVFNSSNDLVNTSNGNFSCFTQNDGLYKYNVEHTYTDASSTLVSYYSPTQTVTLDIPISVDFDFTSQTYGNNALIDNGSALISVETNVPSYKIAYIMLRHEIINNKSPVVTGTNMEVASSNLTVNYIVEEGETFNITGLLILNNGSRYYTESRLIHRVGIDFTSYTFANDTKTIHKNNDVGVYSNVPSINISAIGISYRIINNKSNVNTGSGYDVFVSEYNNTYVFEEGETFEFQGTLILNDGRRYTTEYRYIHRVPVDFDFTSSTLANNTKTTKENIRVAIETNALSSDISAMGLSYKIINNKSSVNTGSSYDLSVSNYDQNYVFEVGETFEIIGKLILLNNSKYFTLHRYITRIDHFNISFNMSTYVNNNSLLNISQNLNNLQCSFDNISFVNCHNFEKLSNMTEFNSLPEGNFMFYVNGTDSSGELYQGNISLTKDTINPNITLNTVSTTITSPEMSGTVSENDTRIYLTIDNNTYLALNNNDGSWSLAQGVISDLVVGSYDVTIVAIDQSGNQKIEIFNNIVVIKQPAPRRTGGGGTRRTRTVDSEPVVEEEKTPLVDYREVYKNLNKNKAEDKEETKGDNPEEKSDTTTGTEELKSNKSPLTGAVVGVGSGFSNNWYWLIVPLVVALWLIFFLLAKKKKKAQKK